MQRFDHHVFLSYARADNEPRNAAGDGWIQLFREDLIARHRTLTGRRLDVFLDTQRIENGDLWETVIQNSLRRSRIFIAVLSPAYLASTICRLELSDYVRMEHVLSPGGSGVRPIYFVTAPPLEKGGMPAPDEEALVSLLQARNRDAGLDWRSWRTDGMNALLELDATERLAALAHEPQPALAPYRHGLETLSGKIAERLDDCALAELARDHGDLQGSYVHFVGRAGEMAKIHTDLVNNQAQVISALHGLGGQGKSALARQYAHAYASYYAAGGRWEVPCEGIADLARRDDPVAPLAAAFDRLAQRMQDVSAQASPADRARIAVLSLTEAQQRLAPADRLKARLARLAAYTRDGWEKRLAALRGQVEEAHSQWAVQHDPRMLVILDNVDAATADPEVQADGPPQFLNAQALAVLGNPDWLELIVTTRLSAAELGDARRFGTLTLGELPLEDALQLLKSFMAGVRPALEGHELQAARDLVRLLGGYTLGVELAGAWLAANRSVTVADYLAALGQRGLGFLDVAGQRTSSADLVRHREKQVAIIVDQTLAGLGELERSALFLSAYFDPELVVADWLKTAIAHRHPEILNPPEPGDPDPWHAALERLAARRLLTPSDSSLGPFEVLRLHRMVRAHLGAIAGPERIAEDKAVLLDVAEAVMAASEQAAETEKYAPQPWLVALSALTRSLRDGASETDSRVARVLNNVGNRLSDLGQREAALEAAQEAVDLYRTLAAANPQAFTPNLAMSLSNLGNRLANLGQREAALEAAQEAADLFRTLAAADPQAFTPDLATSVNNLGNRFADFGRREAALEAAQEAVTLRRTLEAANPQAFTPDLATSLNNLGKGFADLGQREAALEATQEAADLYRALAAENPQAFTPDLAMSLSNLGGMFSNLGRWVEELEGALEAVTLWRTLEAANRQAFTPGLARSLRTLGQIHLASGDNGAAKAAFAEVISLITPFAEASPQAFGGLAGAHARSPARARGGAGPSAANDLQLDEALADPRLVALAAQLLDQTTGKTWANLHREEQRQAMAMTLMFMRQAREQARANQGGGIRVDLAALGLDLGDVEAAFAQAEAGAQDLAGFKAALRTALLSRGGKPEAVEALLGQIGDDE